MFYFAKLSRLALRAQLLRDPLHRDVSSVTVLSVLYLLGFYLLFFLSYLCLFFSQRYKTAFFTVELREHGRLTSSHHVFDDVFPLVSYWLFSFRKMTKLARGFLQRMNKGV